MGREKTLEAEGREATRLQLPLNQIIDTLGENNHLYDSPENLSDEELEWKRRRRELIEQEIVSRIESEEDGRFTKDINKILTTSDIEGANVQATTEVLQTYLIENTEDFSDRLTRESIKFRLENGRKNSGVFGHDTGLPDGQSLADIADMGVIGLGIVALLFLFIGIAFSGIGMTVFGLSLLTFAGKVSGVFAAMGMVLAAFGRLVERE